MSKALQPLVTGEFWQEAWSWPVLEKLIQNPHDIEAALNGLQDEQLAREVQAALVESVGPLTIQTAFSCVELLYSAHIVRREREIRAQIEQYGSEGAPPELIKKHRDIKMERHRVAETLDSLITRG